MRILLIAKVIHPTQSPRSFRVTELAKELGRRGYDVTLYANIGKYDYQSFEKKYQITIRDIGTMHLALKNSDGSYSRPYLQKVLRRIFGKWLYAPDIEFLWKISHILKHESYVDLLITIAAPHSIHWGAAWHRSRQSDSSPFVWIADCGDPFMGNAFINPPRYFSYFEKLMCHEADYITIPIEEARSAYETICQDKIHVIPQGFNFELPVTIHEPDNSVPTFLYAGNFYPPERDPRPFLDHLSRLDLDFEFIIHTTHKSLIIPYKKVLGKKLKIEKFIPREELIAKMRKMDFLVNFDNSTKIHSPSKLIDYTIAGRPVLSVKSKLINSNVIKEFMNGNYQNSIKLNNISQYHIKEVTNKFLNLYYSK